MCGHARCNPLSSMTKRDADSNFARGWYCIAGSDELPGSNAPAPAQPIDKHYFGTRLQVMRSPSGGITASFAAAPGSSLPVREALGLIFVWYPGKKMDPQEAPAFELPWARLSDPAWRYLASGRREVEVVFSRPFCDYFDHWHTRTIHQIPSRDASSWFAEHTCGVQWETLLDASYTGIGALRHLPFKLRGRSCATLYGLGFAIDELSHAGLKLVNLQTNTPIDGQRLEMRTLVGVRAARLPPLLTTPLLRILLRTVEREVAKDLVYWARCRERDELVRDAESDDEMAKFARWCEALP